MEFNAGISYYIECKKITINCTIKTGDRNRNLAFSKFLPSNYYFFFLLLKLQLLVVIVFEMVNQGNK